LQPASPSIGVLDVDGQQLFEKAADAAAAVNKVDFQYPVARDAPLIGLAQTLAIVMTD